MKNKVLLSMMIVWLVQLPVGNIAAQVKKPVCPKIDMRMGLRALIALADAHLHSLRCALQTVAISDEVRSGEWEKMKGLLQEMAKGQVPAISLYIQPDGSYYSSAQGLTDKNIADRPYFQRLMSGETVIGDLVISRSTGKKATVLAVPVLKEGKVVAAVGTSIFLDELSKLLAREITLPDNMVFYALNAQGETALHSDTKWLLAEPAKMESATLAKSVQEILNNSEGLTSYEFQGAKKVAAFATSPLTGWHFALGFVQQSNKN